MNHPKPLLLTATLSLTTLIGYGAYRLWYAEATQTDAAIPRAAEPAPLADSLPSFTLADLEGSPTSIESWTGQPLVINFWATWCAPCLREIPLLKSLQQAAPDIRVVGIAVDRPDAVLAFADEIAFNYPILVGQGDAMDAATDLGLDVFVLPSTVFTTATGATLGIRVGELHPEHLSEYQTTLAALAAGEIDLAAARQQFAGMR